VSSIVERGRARVTCSRLQFADAVDVFLTGVAIDSKDATIHYNMAAAYDDGDAVGRC
jgi:hypothetical protein